MADKTDKMGVKSIERMMKSDREQLKRIEKSTNKTVGKVKGNLSKNKGRIF